MTLHERVTLATHALVAAGYNDAEAAIDAELLARYALGWTREQMLVRWRDPIPPTSSIPPLTGSSHETGAAGASAAGRRSGRGADHGSAGDRSAGGSGVDDDRADDRSGGGKGAPDVIVSSRNAPNDTDSGSSEVSRRSTTSGSGDSRGSSASEAIGREFETRYAALIERRARREPVAYIVGHREFWNLEIAVTRDTLIPRPETELIVEETLALAQHVPSRLGSDPVIVDVGTGSGCLAIAIAHELRTAQLIAIDVSTAALDVAKRNARTHGVADRISWHAGSLLEPVTQPVDLIVSNPPYVPLRDATTLQADVRDYEPAVALFSGDDGLATIRALVNQARGHVRPEGWLIFEFGYGQADAVRELVDRSDAWYLVRLRHDLQDIPRTAVLQRKS